MGEFRKAIDRTKSQRSRPNRRSNQEREAAAKSQLQKAREKAMMVRRIRFIIPLLNGARDDFAAETKEGIAELAGTVRWKHGRILWNCRNPGGFRWCATAILHDQAWSICSGVWR